MDTAELLKKVRKIEIKTRGISSHLFSGEYHSAFKGRGMSFSEVREYQYGDDIRAIDWNVTARFHQPFVKIFEEERELTVLLMVDVSGSSVFGSEQLKKDMMTEISAVLSFSAINNNDKVGLICFSDEIELFLPPRKGHNHILKIIRDLLELDPKSRKTSLKGALEFLNNIQKRKAIVFVLSDFVSGDYKDALQIASRRHDVIALKITDPLEEQLPSIGLVKVQDPESGNVRWLDTSSTSVRKTLESQFRTHKEYFSEAVVKCGASHLEIKTNESYTQKLLRFFKRR